MRTRCRAEGSCTCDTCNNTSNSNNIIVIVVIVIIVVTIIIVIIGYINQTFLTSTQIVEFYYTKTDTDSLLANKVSNTGSVSLPGHIYIYIYM